MSLRRMLLALGAASVASSCSVIFSLDGFDKGTTGSGGRGGADAGESPDTGVADAPSPDGEAGPMGPCDGQPDGTMCSPAKDACHAPGTCTMGACTDGQALADGTMCSPAKDACHAPGTCTMGACVDGQALADGTMCSPAKDACHAPGTCTAGACVDGPALADGAGFDANAHTACCGGVMVSLTTNTDCNVCGLKCINNQTCQPQGTNPTIYQCTGCAANGGNSSCWSNCCVLTVNSNGICSASDCAGHCPSPDTCPNGSACVGSHPTDRNNYCSY
jgi:hypothetical protein